MFAAILDRFRRTPAPSFTDEDARDEADRAASAPDWAAARTLADLGELTARWLTGDLASQPGYYGRVDVDEDDAPGLTAALVALNLAGVVTNSSQAGYDGTGYDGKRWTQHAWVSAHTDPSTSEWLAMEATAAGFEVTEWTRGMSRRTVTYRAGRSYTEDGPIGRSDLHCMYDGVGRGAWRDLLGAVHVSIVDPVPGRNIMWAWLEQFATEMKG